MLITESDRIPIRSSTLIDLILIPEGIGVSISLNKMLHITPLFST